MDINILWLVPLSYAIHIVEESPRFVPWTKNYPWLFPTNYTVRKFIFGNCLFMTYVLVSVFLATAYQSQWTLILGLSTAGWIFANFILHASTTLYSGEYSPGVVTAGAIYVPILLYIYVILGESGILSSLDIIWSIIIGFAVMYLPSLLTYKFGREMKEKPNNQNDT